MRGWRLATVRGIAIEINYTWLILFALLLFTIADTWAPDALGEYSRAVHWAAALIATLLIIASLLLHELAHSLVAKAYGLGVSRITLFVFGGVSQMEEEPQTATSELVMAAAGPATSIALGAIFGVMWMILRVGEVWPFWIFVCGHVSIINFMLAVFNMLPGFPLDGGRILRAVLWSALGDMDRATQIAAFAGQMVGFGMIALGFMLFFAHNPIGGLWLLAIGWLLAGAAEQSRERVHIEHVLGKIPVEAVMSSPVITIPVDIDLRQAVDDYYLALRHAAFPVEGDEGVVGLLTLRQIAEVPQEEWPYRSVGEVVTPLDVDSMTIRVGSEAVEALLKMAQNGQGRLLVLDDNGNLVGIISQTDIMNLVRIKTGLGVTT